MARFWHGGAGPTTSSIATVFQTVGVDPQGSNKEAQVRSALNDATDGEAAELLDRLVAELRLERTFSSTDPVVAGNVIGLRESLVPFQIELDTDGKLGWPGESDESPGSGARDQASMDASTDRDRNPAGASTQAPRQKPPASPPRPTPPRDSRRVFLVHGRNSAVRDDFVEFLRALDLKIVGWEEAVTATGQGGAPYIGDVLTAGMDMAGAVVVLFTPDDLGMAKAEFQYPEDERHETQLTGQARLNVIFEAGMAMERDRSRVVLVEVGRVRAMSDTSGVHVIRLRDNIEVRKALVSRLKAVGLSVDDSGEKWREIGNFTLPDGDSTAQVASTDGTATPVSDHGEAETQRLEQELGLLCANAEAQGWKVKTNSATTLRLVPPNRKGVVHTLSKRDPYATRKELRTFVAKLRADGLRVSNALRLEPEKSPY
ncbi:nucleotide-binding protein [Rhodococcus sp. GG48]|nr:nucleotide-binding protein [Rhodococcus sp. GG48]